LELQAWPGGRIGRCWNIQGGGETDGLPWLVDASCEVGERAVLGYAPPRPMGQHQARVRSVQCERSSGNGKEEEVVHVPREGTGHILSPNSDERNP
jgi:hypothetical protein